MIRPLGKEELTERWNEIKPYVERANAYGQGEGDAFSYFENCMAGRYECWESIVDGKTMSFAMVRVNTFPKHKQLQIMTASGEDWDLYGPEALAYAENVAREIGCKNVTIWGRPGWDRKLKPLGYKKVYTVVSKEV